MPCYVAIRNPVSLFRAEHIVAMSPCYWLLLDIIQGAYGFRGITHDQVVASFSAIALFSGLVYLSSVVRPSTLPKFIEAATTKQFDANTIFALAVIAFTLAFLKFAIPSKFNAFEMISAFGKSRWDVPWARGRLGDWNAFADHLEYFGYMLPALTVVIASKTRWQDRRTLATLCLSAVFLAFLAQGGNRRLVGACVGAALIVFALKNRRRGALMLVKIGLGATFLLIFLQLVLEFRGVGLAGLVDPNGKQLQYTYLHVDDNFLRLTQLLAVFPDQHPFLGFNWVIWVIVRPVPRVFWPGKPVDPGFDLAIFLGLKGISLAVTTIGESYMAFGWTGIVGMALTLGRVSRTWTSLIDRNLSLEGSVLYALGTMVLFLGMRSALELILISYSIIAWLLLARLFGRKRRAVHNS
jgi:oligosaccharide repeat unit polymerase